MRQEPQGSSPGFECAGSDSDRRVPAELGQESQASSCVEEWIGVRSGGAPLPPRRKGQASAEEGMADGQSAKEVAGAGRHLEQAHGAGVRAGETGAAVPGGPDALATGSGPLRSRAASPVVPGPGLPPHLALAGETRQGCGWGAGGQGQRRLQMNGWTVTTRSLYFRIRGVSLTPVCAVGPGRHLRCPGRWQGGVGAVSGLRASHGQEG